MTKKSAPAKPQFDWVCYLIRQPNGSLYCGVTNDVERRFAMHCEGKGAKALRGKGPLKLVWQSHPLDKRESMRLEWRIKRLSKARKESLVTQGSGAEASLLSACE